ncbi:unnamed protein product [Microthlaspi erraticum]|uniref:DUF4216 domain-containing protein n=1 Tax=Microthlaspi erraticum TaxID=1685480 RepID=A0A6D2K5M1_9BRAS|nr:unnamed protein product [Microthlaspi erraticum]
MEDVNVMRHFYGIPLDSDDHGETLKWLAYGPLSSARSYTGYIVNGQQFHTRSVDRKSQNSGVFYEATAVYRSSAKDTSQCQWAVKANGVKIEDGFTIVNMNHSQVSFSKDPYILASHAKQVFYLREDESSNWHVVMRGPSQRYSKKESDDGLAEIGPLPSSVVMDVDMEEAEKPLNTRGLGLGSKGVKGKQHFSGLTVDSSARSSWNLAGRVDGRADFKMASSFVLCVWLSCVHAPSPSLLLTSQMLQSAPKDLFQGPNMHMYANAT